MVLLPGLLSTDRFASERSAVTRVIEILGWGVENHSPPLNFKPQASPYPGPTNFLFRGDLATGTWKEMPPEARAAHLPSNLCLRKSKRAFCIMSVTWVGGVRGKACD